ERALVCIVARELDEVAETIVACRIRIEEGSERGQRRMLEDRAEAGIAAKHFLNAEREIHRQKRIAAECEEVGICAGGLRKTEHFGKKGGQHDLGRAARLSETG